MSLPPSNAHLLIPQSVIIGFHVGISYVLFIVLARFRDA
jgi:hypothetical protein